MRYATYEYYLENFSGWTDPRIPAEEFNRFEKQAELEINAATHGRAALLETIPEAVKDCACAVAEVIYDAKAQADTYTAQGLAGPLASWSNDGQSGSVDLSQSTVTKTGRLSEIRRLCRLYLGPLGLLYAGVMHYES